MFCILYKAGRGLTHYVKDYLTYFDRGFKLNMMFYIK